MTTHVSTGWSNLCQHCGVRYWIRRSDLHRPKMRRFVSEESTELHECRPEHVQAMRER